MNHTGFMIYKIFYLSSFENLLRILKNAKLHNFILFRGNFLISGNELQVAY